MVKFRLLLTFVLITAFTSQAQTSQLKSGKVVLKNKRYQVVFIEEQQKQYLVCKDIESNKEVKRVQVRPKGDGRLNEVSDPIKSGTASVIQLRGNDGDSSFFEVIAWNEKSGEIARLLVGDSFDVSLGLNKSDQLTVLFKQDNNASDYGSFHLLQQSGDKTCFNKVAEIAKLEKESSAIIKNSGGIPKGEDSLKLEQISKKKQHLTPREFQFGLSDFSKIKVSCK